VRALTSADAQLRVADCFKGRLSESPYFAEYDKAQVDWKMVVGEIDGEALLLVFHRNDNVWKPAYPVRIQAADGIIDRIADYYACAWMMPAASATVVASVDPNGTGINAG
jgi:RNA polymerase sigma-70 factor (ECF subfamily)